MDKEELHRFNMIIGNNIRIERLLSGQTQAALGEAIGVTFQQIQKYEQGRNSIIAPRLLRLADHLRVPVMNFFKESGERPVYEQYVPDHETVSILSELRFMSTEQKRALVNMLKVQSRAECGI